MGERSVVLLRGKRSVERIHKWKSFVVGKREGWVGCASRLMHASRLWIDVLRYEVSFCVLSCVVKDFFFSVVSPSVLTCERISLVFMSSGFSSDLVRSGFI